MVLSIFGALAEAILQGMGLLAGYVTNSSTFPQPLSEEDEGKYLTRLQAGDEEARAVLIERNLRLVAHIVKKFDNTGEETDDLISIGTVGLIKAIGTFRPDKGTRLATYAARCIENEMAVTYPMRKRLAVATPPKRDKKPGASGTGLLLCDFTGDRGHDRDHRRRRRSRHDHRHRHQRDAPRGAGPR